MDNLTVSSKIVMPEQPGIQPQPGYYLVLMRQVRSGRIFHSVLQPGEWTLHQNALKRMILNEGHNLISIPVSANRNLRHDMTSHLEHVSPGHAFEATYFLDFMVRDPELVATGWQQDPIRMIEAEIHRMLDPISRATLWDTLRAHILRDAGALLFRDQLRDAVDQLQPFAQTRGFHVHGIRMRLELSREDQKPEIAQAAWERDHTVRQAEHQGKLAAQTRDSQMQAEGAKRQEELRQIQRQGEIKDALAAAFVKSIEGASTSERPEDFLSRLRVLTPLLNGSQGMNLSNGSMAFPQPQTMLAAGSSRENKVCGAVLEIATVVESLEGEAAQKQQILSLILHLIAEAYRGPNASVGEAGKYSAAIDALIHHWSPGLDTLKLKTLYRFRDLITLQELLKP